MFHHYFVAFMKLEEINNVYISLFQITNCWEIPGNTFWWTVVLYQTQRYLQQPHHYPGDTNWIGLLNMGAKFYNSWLEVFHLYFINLQESSKELLKIWIPRFWLLSQKFYLLSPGGEPRTCNLTSPWSFWYNPSHKPTLGITQNLFSLFYRCENWDP